MKKIMTVIEEIHTNIINLHIIMIINAYIIINHHHHIIVIVLANDATLAEIDLKNRTERQSYHIKFEKKMKKFIPENRRLKMK